ncbi:MAG: alpha/beta hydrolase [Marinilabiliales bacterium]
MKQHEYIWKSYDGLNYYGKSWSNGHHAKGVINLVHGIGEHCARYEELAQKFVENGFDVISMDYRGHGKSEGKKGHTPSYKHYMYDIDMLLSKSMIIFPNLPVILYGHSMGGNLVLNYVLRKNPAIFSLIVTSPWLKLAFESPAIKIKTGKILKNIIPAFTQKTGLKTKNMSSNPDIVEKYENDNLVHGKITLRTFFEVRKAGEYAMENASKLYLPTLLMHGSADMITSWEASKETAAKSNYITFKLWENCYHELHNEPIKDEIFQYTINWLNQVIKQK